MYSLAHALAAHVANAGIPVLLLDIVPPGLDDSASGDRDKRNAFASGALKKMLKSKPAAFTHASRASLVEVGNFDDDLDRVADVDLVIEAVVERLQHAVVTELKTLVVLVPLMVSNLAAEVSQELWAVDASPFGDGAAAAVVPSPGASELWRRRERRGAYTRLQAHWQATLRSTETRLDLDSLEPDMYGSRPRPERVLIETFDFIEICSGPQGPVSAAVAAAGLRTGPRIDLAVSA